MSNVNLELGQFPPTGTALILKVTASPISAPEGIEGGAALWNITGVYSLNPQITGDPNAVLQTMEQWPQGFGIAFSVSADELPSAVHMALAVSRYFGFPQPLRDLDPQDPLTKEIPDLNQFLYAPDGEGQTGTNLRQPAMSPHYNPLWFLGEVSKLVESGQKALQAQLAEHAKAKAVAAPALPALTIDLHPGTVSPLLAAPVVSAVEAPSCKAPKCTNKVHAKGHCRKHHTAKQRAKGNASVASA